MRTHFTLTCVALLAALSIAPSARACGDHPSSADAGIAKQLESLDYEFEVDDDGDYRMIRDMDDDRTQLVFVISKVESYGVHKIREVWAPAYRSPEDDALPADIANRLLADSQDSKLGSWVKQGDMAVFVVKIAADASTPELKDAIEAAAKTADEMESDLTDGKDAF
ncbi:hypothetical protein [Lysobacter panacisoli]|uniref:Uncharacterized protein n=1 Tax=Lysobacter panacisoli TaxID=1255263 RepID=A0ABP9LE47_9GAMM|nr:hypothetical protein [Lysobacter panacisoli]